LASTRVVRDLESAHHEVHEFFPVGVGVVAGEYAYVFEKLFPAAQFEADAPIGSVVEVQEGVHQEGEDVQRGEHGAEVFLPVPEVVFERVAFGFERVVVFVLDFPPAPPAFGQSHRVLFGDFMIGDECVFIGLLFPLHDDVFNPVYAKGAFPLFQGEIVYIPQRMGFPFSFRVSDPLALHADVLVRVEQVDPAVEMRMRERLAYENEMVVVEQRHAAKGLVGIEPSLGGGDFTLLLVVSVLRGEKLDAKGYDELAGLSQRICVSV